MLVGLLLALVGAAQDPANTPPDAPARPLATIELLGASAFPREQLLDVLRLAEGRALRRPPESVAQTLETYYHLEGYLAARVRGSYDEAGFRLLLEVDEGRLAAVELDGLEGAAAARARRALNLEPGRPLREADLWEALLRLEEASQGAVKPAEGTAYSVEAVPEGVRLRVHLRVRRVNVRFGPGGVRPSGRYNRVDGFAPGVRLDTALADLSSYKHLQLFAFGAYGFSAQTLRYALGFVRPFGPRGGTFLGYDFHDLSDTEDMFRRYGLEEAPKGLINTAPMTDLFRRLGHQAFVQQKLGKRTQLGLLFRSDGYSSLPVTTIDPLPKRGAEDDNPPVDEGRLRSLILSVRLVSRGALFDDEAAERHALYQPSLFGTGDFRRPEALRVEASYELSNRGLGSDFEFTRSIARLRYHRDLSDHVALDGRLLLGATTGSVPSQKLFAIGGGGTLLGYDKKQFVGGSMALLNLEWAFSPGRLWPAVIPFYGAGQVFRGVAPEDAGFKSDVGGGVRWPPRARRVFARLDGAVPLALAPGDKRRMRYNLRIQIPF